MPEQVNNNVRLEAWKSPEMDKAPVLKIDTESSTTGLLHLNYDFKPSVGLTNFSPPSIQTVAATEDSPVDTPLKLSFFHGGRKCYEPIPANVSKRPICKNVNIVVFYHLGRLVASGAFGQIFEATERATGIRFAVKKINKLHVTAAGFSWSKELTIAEQMNHNHIVRVHQIFDEVTNLCIVMEMCDGQDLFTYLESLSTPLTEVQCAHLMRQMISSLEHCHSRGVAHRDVKPENFLFSRCPSDVDSVLKLVDFGLAIQNHKANRFQQSNDRWIRATHFAGSPHYAAPEVLSYEATLYNEKCDLWSLGIIFFFLLTRNTPTNIIGGDDAGCDPQIVRSVSQHLPKFFDVIDDESDDCCQYHASHLDETRPDTATYGFLNSFERVKISSKAYCLLSCLLQLDPAKRISARDALSHSWLVSLNPTAVECCDDLFIQQMSSPRSRRNQSLSLTSSRISLLRELNPRSTAIINHDLIDHCTASGAPDFGPGTIAVPQNGSDAEIWPSTGSICNASMGTVSDYTDFENADPQSVSSPVKLPNAKASLPSLVLGKSDSDQLRDSDELPLILRPHEPEDVARFAYDVRNILKIVTEEVYALWLYGWLSLDPLQRSLRGLLARTILDYRSRFEGDGILDKWVAVFRSLDVNGVGNITEEGLAIAIRTLVNGSKIYASAAADELSHGIDVRRANSKLLYQSSDVVHEWGRSLQNVHALEYFSSDDDDSSSSQRSSMSGSILASKSFEMSNSVPSEPKAHTFTQSVKRNQGSLSTERDAPHELRRCASASTPRSMEIPNCECLEQSPAVMGHVGDGLEDVHLDTEEGIQKLLQLFRFVDIEARGILEPHVFLASVLDNSYLDNMEIIEQMYNHIRSGSELTVELLRHHLDWNTAQVAASLSFCNSVFWPTRQLEMDAETCRATEQEIRRLFRVHGFCRTPQSPDNDSSITIGDNIQTISLELFAEVIKSCKLHRNHSSLSIIPT